MTRYLRAELMLPLTIVGAAAMVAVSEFMTTFEFTAGGEAQSLSLASDRHSYALLILAVLTVVGMAYAITTGLRAAAVGTAVLGCAALLLFLVLDLPDAGKAGPLDDDPALYFADARADPAAGFWLEALGTVILGLTTVAFATLNSAQLRAPMELLGRRRAERPAEAEEAEPRGPFDGETDEKPKERRSWLPVRKPKGKAEPKRRKEAAEPKRREATTERKRREATTAEPKPRRSGRERTAREVSTARPRTASEERAAARERLAQSRSKAPADARSKDAEEQSEKSRSGLRRRLSGNDG